MNIGIIASSDRDLKATSLIEKLISNGNRPDCVFRAEEPKLTQVRNYLRSYGVRATIEKILDAVSVREMPSHMPREYLRQYAKEQGLDFSDSLSASCEKHALEVVSVDTMNSAEAIAQVRQRSLDLLLTTGGEILRTPVIQAARIGIINAHSASLPTYRGFNVMEWSLFHADRIGVALHYIDPGIDTGDLLDFREIPIEPGDTIEILRGKLFPAMIDIMSSGVQSLQDGTLLPSPQAPAAGKQFFSMHPRLKRIVDTRLADSANGNVHGNQQ